MDGENDNVDEMMLPGFRFHPTDEELVGFYLKRKIQHLPLSIELIRQLDIYKYDPWDLPKLATTGEKEWYFYCPRDRKYRNSTRPNRVTEAGFWKATGTDRPIYSSHGSVSKCIGLKKSLVFYRGRAAKGIKTDWMMHEFRLPSPNDATRCPSANTDKYTESWAICRIFRKTSTNSQRPSILATHNYRPLFFSPPPINYDTSFDENNALTIAQRNEHQLDTVRQTPISKEPCRPTFPTDGHYYGLDPSKLIFQPQSDTTSLALPRMPSSIIPHQPSEARMRSDFAVGSCCGNEEPLPFKSLKDNNGGGETREDINLFDLDSARGLTGSAIGDDNAWISNFIWDYDVPSWPAFGDFPTYTTDCYT